MTALIIRRLGLRVFVLLALITNAHIKIALAESTETAKTLRCTTPEFHQFDFWVGDWNAYDFDNPTTIVAHNRVSRILDGCVLLEDYQGTDGHKGQSFTIYDASRKVWHQSWVTNRGELLTIEGTFQDGQIVLTGTDKTADGKPRIVRGFWKPVENGVRETADTSLDGGKTWKPWFDIVFRPSSQTSLAALTEDQRAVAALDTEYQAAVKKNDATTMDRVLADDFLLVTGSGKRYSKADLLREARSGKVQYEHQEDTDQSVRVWGDTAVVTAKLWEKGTDNGQSFDKTVWFSDTYVRTPDGWRYAFGQSSLALPQTDK